MPQRTLAKGLRAPDLEDVKTEILECCQQSKTKEQILEHIQVVATPYAFKKYIKKLVETRFLNFTIPHIPSHTAQQYIISGKGLLYLKQLNT